MTMYSWIAHLLALLVFVSFHLKPGEAGSEFVGDQASPIFKRSCLAGTGIPPFMYGGGSQQKPLWKYMESNLYRENFKTCCDVITYFPVHISSLTFVPSGTDTVYGDEDKIVIRFAKSAQQVVEHGMPWKVSKTDIDKWLQATAETSDPDTMELLNLGRAYEGVWNDTRTLVITVKDARGASSSLFSSNPPNVHFRIVGNLSDSHSGNLFMHIERNNASKRIITNTIDCGTDTEPAGANCRVNLTTLPNSSTSTLINYKVASRSGRFDRIHIRGAYLSTEQNTDGSSSNCNRESIILNLVLSHNVINASTADNNVNVSSLIDIGTNNANLDLRSSHMILQNVAVSDLAIFRPGHKGDIAFLERAGKRNTDWREIYRGNSPLNSLGIQNSYQAVAFGDVNGDQIDDYALFNIQNRLIRFTWNNESKGFVQDSIWKSSCDNCSVAIGSIRGEQHEDSFLIVIGYLDGMLEFYSGYTNPSKIYTTSYESATPTVAITQFSNDDRRLHVLVAYSDGALRYFQYAPESQIVTENLNHANIFAKYNFTFVRSPVFIDFDNDGDIDLVANKAKHTKDGPGLFAIFENHGTNLKPLFLYEGNHITLKTGNIESSHYVSNQVALAVVRLRTQSLIQIDSLIDKTFETQVGFPEHVAVKALEGILEHLPGENDYPPYNKHMELFIQNRKILSRPLAISSILDISNHTEKSTECPDTTLKSFRIYFSLPIRNDEVADVSNKTEIQSFLKFNKNLGASYSGKWIDNCTYQIDIISSDGQDLDVIGSLHATILPTYALPIFVACISSQHVETTNVAVIAPQVSEHIESFEAFGSNCTYITGSTFVITFQGGLDIHTMSATNKSEINEFIQFSPDIGRSYTGKWSVQNKEGVFYQQLTIEVLDTTGGPSHNELPEIRGILKPESLKYSVGNQTTCNYLTGSTPKLEGSFSKIPQIVKVTISANANKDLKWGKGVLIDIELNIRSNNPIGKQDQSKAESLKYFKPSIDLGAAYIGVWNRFNNYRIEIVDPTGNGGPEPGTLFFTAQESLYGENVFDTHGNLTGPGICPPNQGGSLPLFPRVYATGSFAGANRIISAIGKDGCTPKSYNVGDRIVITLAQSSLQEINGLPVLYDGDDACLTIFDLNNALSQKQKYKCLKMAIYQYLQLSSSFRSVCIGHMAWMKWTTPKSFEILIEDPRDDCSGMGFESGFTEYPTEEVQNNLHPPKVVGEESEVHTKEILKDFGLGDTDFPTVFELQPIFSGRKTSSTNLKGGFTGGFEIISPSSKHVLIDLKVLYSIILVELPLRGKGLLSYTPRINANDLLLFDSDVTFCCGVGNEVAKSDTAVGYKACCQTIVNNEALQYASFTPKLYLCMKGMDCPSELIPYLMKTTNQAGNTVLNNDCTDPSGLCLLQKESTTYSSANLFFQKSAFAIRRGFDIDENPIQDKLGGAMEAHFYDAIGGEHVDIIATIGWIEKLSPLYADAGAETLISIKGEDFDDTYKTGGYKCHFSDEVGNEVITNATVFNTSLLHCYTPIWLYKAKSVNVEVSRFNIKLQTGFCDETICKTTNALITYTKLLNITFYESWTRTLVQNTSVSGGISVIEGNGFNMSSAGYRCKLQFSNNSLYYVVSPPAFPVSSTRIICFLPKWPFEIIETKIMLYQNHLPVQKRDTSFEQNHTLTGFCKQAGGLATAFVHGISITVYSRHSNSTIPTVMLQNENGDFIYIKSTMTNTNKFAALLKTLIPESHISRDDFEVATIYNVTKLPEGVTHTWISKFSTKAAIFLTPVFKAFKISQASTDQDWRVHQFNFNGLHYPTVCHACPSAIKSGWDYTCARSSESGIKCWGDNSQRQLYPEYDPVILPDQKSWIKYDTISWKSFKLGYTHTCGVEDVTGMPICYGLQYPGLQIKIEAPSMLRFSDVSAGAFHTCGVTVDGRLSCWGEQLFSKATPPTSFCHRKEPGMMFANAKFVDPKQLACTQRAGVKETPYISIESSVSHNCAIESADNSVMCWGDNSGMQLGLDNCNGTKLDEDERTCAVTPGPFVGIALGIQHTCGLFTDGIVKCWGATLRDYHPPEGTKFRSIASGHRHACGIANDASRVYCWGDNVKGQSDAPTDTGYVEVSAGAQHSCALKVLDDTTDTNRVEKVICWGNYNGQRIRLGSPTWHGYQDANDPGYVTKLNEEMTSDKRVYPALCFPREEKQSCNSDSQVKKPVYRRCYKALGCGDTYSQVLPHLKFREKWNKSREIQTVKLHGATGGTFALRYGNETTGQLQFNAGPNAVRTAIEGLYDVANIDVTCKGDIDSVTWQFCNASEWRFEFKHFGPRKDVFNVSTTNLVPTSTAIGGTCYMRKDGQILSTRHNVECMAGSASLGKNYDYVLANIYHNPYAGNIKLSGVLYCVEVKGNSTVVTIKSLNRFSSKDLSYEEDKRWNGEWVGNLIPSNITSGQSRRENIERDLQQVFANPRIRVFARHEMWCFDLRTNDSIVRTEEHDAYEIETSNAECFRTRSSIASAKDNIDNYRKRLVARELERRRYTADAVIFTILVVVMTLLASHSWAEIVLFESNNDTINEKVFQTEDADYSSPTVTEYTYGSDESPKSESSASESDDSDYDEG